MLEIHDKPKNYTTTHLAKYCGAGLFLKKNEEKISPSVNVMFVNLTTRCITGGEEKTQDNGQQ